MWDTTQISKTHGHHALDGRKSPAWEENLDLMAEK